MENGEDLRENQVINLQIDNSKSKLKLLGMGVGKDDTDEMFKQSHNTQEKADEGDLCKEHEVIEGEDGKGK